MEASDLDLLGRWGRGDLGAGDALFNRHFESIHRFFRNKVGDQRLEDLVQQTFMGCVEGRDRFKGGSTFRTYLFGVAHNLLRDHFRRIRRDDEVLDWGHLSAADWGAGPSTILVKRREQRVLLEALRRIPVESQIVLELYYWEDMSASEVATILEVPEGTVRGRVRRAKQLLRQQLGQLSLSPDVLNSTVQNLERWAESLREMLAVDPSDREGAASRANDDCSND